MNIIQNYQSFFHHRSGSIPDGAWYEKVASDLELGGTSRLTLWFPPSRTTGQSWFSQDMSEKVAVIKFSSKTTEKGW